MKQTKLFTRDFTLVVIGQIISLFGNAVLRLTLPLYLLEVTGSSALFGLVSAAAFVPMVALAPLGGVAADRLPKARTMAALDFFTCGLTLAVALLLGRAPLIPLLLVSMALLYAVQGAYQPVVSASIPLLAGPEGLMGGNAAINLVASLSGLLGPVLGGLLYAAVGLMPVLWVSAGCFLLSAVMELFIRIPHRPAPMERSVWSTVKGDMAQGLDYLFRQERALSHGVWIVCGFNLLFSAMLIVGMPVIITQRLGLAESLYGFAQGAMGLGGLLGGLLAGALGSRLSVRRSWLLLALGAACAGGMALPLALNAPALVCYGVLAAMVLSITALATLFQVVMLAFVQGRTPDHLVGKVISCVMALSMCASPLGQALYGTLFEHLPAWSAVAFSALGSGALALRARRVFRAL
ncbi:MAG: MFS transporter [Lawsonibacter sp.]|nr:MFS transporter [Lawsonibacter sp.]